MALLPVSLEEPVVEGGVNYAIVCEATLRRVNLADVWAVWSDLASYPEWDPREEINKPNGPLAVGTTGVLKQRDRGAGTYVITAVEPGSGWTSQTSLPGGRLVIDHQVGASADGVVVRKTYTAEGPMALAFRWFFAKDIRAQMPGSFAALEGEIIRRNTTRR